MYFQRFLVNDFRLAIFFLLIILCKSVNADDGSSVVPLSLGEVILLQDKVSRLEDDLYRSGGLHVVELIEKVYKERISKLPVKERQLFFWSVIINVHLDASYLEQLYMLIADDCGEELMAMMNAYLIEHKELGIVAGDNHKKIVRSRRIMATMLASKESKK